MEQVIRRKLKIAWLIADDIDGGIVSVARACCEQAALNGIDITLLMALPPKRSLDGWTFRHETLGSLVPYSDIPKQLKKWVEDNSPDVLIVNGCDEADVAIPYLPSRTRIIYVVHDTAPRYYRNAVRWEASIDGIVCVSQVCADEFARLIVNEDKLSVIANAAKWTISYVCQSRGEDCLFLGGDNIRKGARDVIEIWRELVRSGYQGKLHWFGQVSDKFRNLARREDKSHNIEFYGWQERSVIDKIASRSKIILAPTRMEAFGLGIVECMGMGCLPVLWDIKGGPKEFIKPHEGRFVPIGKYTLFARAAFELLARHEVVYMDAAQRIRTEYSVERLWGDYKRTIDLVVENAPSHRPYVEQEAPRFKAPLRIYQLVPRKLRGVIARMLGRAPRISYLLRNFRGV